MTNPKCNFMKITQLLNAIVSKATYREQIDDKSLKAKATNDIKELKADIIKEIKDCGVQAL